MVNDTNIYVEKSKLVKDHIKPLLMRLYPEIDDVEYERTKAGIELVHIIYYQDPIIHITDHCIDSVNVTADSLIALVSDVIAAVRWR